MYPRNLNGLSWMNGISCMVVYKGWIKGLAIDDLIPKA